MRIVLIGSKEETRSIQNILQKNHIDGVISDIKTIHRSLYDDNNRVVEIEVILSTKKNLTI